MTTSTTESEKRIRAKEKLARIPIKIEKTEDPMRKPHWIRVKLPTGSQVEKIKGMLRDKKLNSVCEEASCPNLPECFSKGTATFMIMGDKCTRRCTFCDVNHGKPDPLDQSEPQHLAESIRDMQLRYVVVTSVDRDDLRDGGAQHFSNCIQLIREYNPGIQVEILVPDFRGRMEVALDILCAQPADVFNHNIETVPALYKQVRPGSDYLWSLKLLQEHKRRLPHIPTKSGLMIGLGETNEQLLQVFADMRAHDIDMLTLGQYLQPTPYHSPVTRYMPPEEFDWLGNEARKLGFTHVASGPLVRSSYHADKQAAGEEVR